MNNMNKNTNPGITGNPQQQAALRQRQHTMMFSHIQQQQSHQPSEGGYVASPQHQHHPRQWQSPQQQQQQQQQPNSTNNPINSAIQQNQHQHQAEQYMLQYMQQQLWRQQPQPPQPQPQQQPQNRLNSHIPRTQQTHRHQQQQCKHIHNLIDNNSIQHQNHNMQPGLGQSQPQSRPHTHNVHNARQQQQRNTYGQQFMHQFNPQSQPHQQRQQVNQTQKNSMHVGYPNSANAPAILDSRHNINPNVNSRVIQQHRGSLPGISTSNLWNGAISGNPGNPNISNTTKSTSSSSVPVPISISKADSMLSNSSAIPYSNMSDNIQQSNWNQRLLPVCKHLFGGNVNNLFFRSISACTKMRRQRARKIRSKYNQGSNSESKSKGKERKQSQEICEHENISNSPNSNTNAILSHLTGNKKYADYEEVVESLNPQTIQRLQNEFSTASNFCKDIRDAVIGIIHDIETQLKEEETQQHDSQQTLPTVHLKQNQEALSSSVQTVVPDMSNHGQMDTKTTQRQPLNNDDEKSINIQTLQNQHQNSISTTTTPVSLNGKRKLSLVKQQETAPPVVSHSDSVISSSIKFDPDSDMMFDNLELFGSAILGNGVNEFSSFDFDDVTNDQKSSNKKQKN